MDITDTVKDAAKLLGTLSVFELKPSLVHSYAVIDCMLHGLKEAHSWTPTITMLHTLRVNSTSLEVDATLLKIQDILIAEQTGTTFVKAKGFKATVANSPTEAATLFESNNQIFSEVFKAGKCTVTLVGDKLQVKTPFSASFLNAIKTLPVPDRKWKSVDQVWEVSEKYKDWTINLIKESYGYQ